MPRKVSKEATCRTQALHWVITSPVQLGMSDQKHPTTSCGNKTQIKLIKNYFVFKHNQSMLTRIQLVFKPHFFCTNERFVHTKLVNLRTKTTSFRNRSLDWFKVPSTRIRITNGGFKNVTTRVDGAYISLSVISY